MVTLDEMVAQFEPKPSGNDSLLVGFEHEVQLFDERTLKPLSYEGEPGLAGVLTTAAELLDGLPPSEDNPYSVQLQDGAQLTLEPGGQLEYSSAPSDDFGGCLRQVHRFLHLLTALRERHGIHVFFGGANPLHTVEEIGLVIPKRRYRLMDSYFPRVGQMGRRMMRQTCSLQVTFDYQDAALGRQLLRAGSIVGPVAAGLLAHAPFLDGRRSELLSCRVPIWQQTDPARCGPLPGVNSRDYSFEDYAAHVVRAPMFFVNTPQGLVDAHGLTFEQFNREGFAGQRATVDDFVLHNSTMFNDVRLKRTIEIRALDGQDPRLVPGALAFLCGLLLCEGARTRALEALGVGLDGEISELARRLAREGLKGELAGGPTRELMGSLLDGAAQGLLSCFADGRDAAAHLDPIAELIDREQTPAEVAMERFGGDPARWLAAGRTFTNG